MKKCPKCQAENAEKHHYCGMCGLPLSPELGGIATAAQEAVAEEMNKARAQWVKEMEKHGDLEAVKIVEKLSGWTKMFLFWVGVPVSLMLLVMGIIGFSNYSQFKAKLEATEATMAAKAKEVTDPLKGLESKFKTLALMTEAENYLKLWDYVAAEGCFRKVLKDLKNRKEHHDTDADIDACIETVFGRTLSCMRDRGDFPAAAEFVSSSFPSDSRQFSTFNDAGFALMVDGIGKPENLKLAEEKLRRAEGMSNGDHSLQQAVFSNWALCFAIEGNFEEARKYGKRFLDAGREPWKAPNEEWFKSLPPSTQEKLKKDVFAAQK